MPQLKSIADKPMESDRADCDHEEINDYFDHLESVLDGSIPALFVINIDQSEFQEWADKRNLIVVVPAEVTQDEIKIPVARTTKRASTLAGIAADGSTITPAVIVPRKTIEIEFLEMDIHQIRLCLHIKRTAFSQSRSSNGGLSKYSSLKCSAAENVTTTMEKFY